MGGCKNVPGEKLLFVLKTEFFGRCRCSCYLTVKLLMKCETLSVEMLLLKCEEMSVKQNAMLVNQNEWLER